MILPKSNLGGHAGMTAYASFDAGTSSIGPSDCRQKSNYSCQSTVAALWEGRLRRVLVDRVDSDPLVGMGLLYDHELVIQVVEGGSVRIEVLL